MVESCLVSRSMSSEFIHVVAKVEIYLSRRNSTLTLFKAGSYSVVCMHHIFFTPSSVDGRLGCSHIFVVVNNATVNTDVHASL